MMATSVNQRAEPDIRHLTVADLIAPTSLQGFLAEYTGTKHGYFPNQGSFDALLTWDRINSILHENRLEYPRLRLSRNGSIVDAAKYTRVSTTNRGDRVSHILAAPLLDELRNDATIILSAIDELHSPIESIALDIERQFHVRTSTNAYIAFGEVQGFDLHWDDHEAFILQVEGHKRWKIYGPTRAFPMFRDVQDNSAPTAQPIAEYVLSPGDVLYIPRGFWHSAEPMNEPTIHLTFGFLPPTGIDLVEWLADSLRNEELFRRGLPLHGQLEAQLERAAELKRVFDSCWSEDIIPRFLANRDAVASLRPRFGLPWSVTGLLPDDGAVRMVSPRGQLTVKEDGSVMLEVAGRRLTLSADVLPTLQLLIDGEPHSLTEVNLSLEQLNLTPNDVTELLVQLIEQGVLTVD